MELPVSLYQYEYNLYFISIVIEVSDNGNDPLFSVYHSFLCERNIADELSNCHDF